MSADSRIFGFLNQQNLQGVPDLIIWPPQDRFGDPAQKRYPLFTLPRMLVWGTVFLIGLIYYIIRISKFNQKIFKKILPSKGRSFFREI